ncbi:helix-turn-helix domain-containing protein [Streptomyces sp. NPDC048483]|uniref:helix-turn-helix domain-containing protein n=1 Tax=Streptomyces sp. NPDC048483 TaxID=3154927 RepID=UPI00344A2622
MSERLYSVEQVAERLGLHVRTIRNYVRDGRLAAVRIGKQYRIAHADLEAFTGRPLPGPPDEDARGPQHAEVSSIVEIDAVSRRTVDRLTTLLTIGVAGRERDGGRQLRIQTVYDEERARMKIVILGSLRDTAQVLEHVEQVLAS